MLHDPFNLELNAMPSNYEIADRLLEIVHEIEALVDEAEALLRPTSEYERARAYPLAHLRCAVSHNHGYLDRSTTLSDIADELLSEAKEEDAA